MAEPLKAIYHEDFLRQFGELVYGVYPSFDLEGFIGMVMDDRWGELALKARMRRITESLGAFLPVSYRECLDILVSIHEECSGFPYLFFPDFIALYGQGEEDWDLSMKGLELFTIQSSAEFAVRPFLVNQPEKMMKQMMEWAKHPNEHVRRLASEGCRPRLPWGEALSIFKRDPAPVLKLLEVLKADLSLYVRKSVANNLNDISKDHPDIILTLVRRWKGVHSNTDWIVRHGCRTLIRKGDSQIMSLFGYGEKVEGAPLTSYASLTVMPATLRIGENCELCYTLSIQGKEPVRLRIEYGIDFVKGRGQTSRKLFLLSDKVLSGGAQVSGRRTHRWKDLTTRRHYPGEHRIALFVNSQEVAHTFLELSGWEEGKN